ncbi:C2H2 and C2HC zinc finger [Glarea lozoyensis ATCC 20868]|uniref:C2H2 and C2HC zinc finger n=2 Tax=Glarea lozoyensis TaxID=101852 RepID=S3DDT8_GLAL2|nr:C2H2 and C2HC zinc finger [Glarea lozoyensis ATCC 20868]EHK99292.1 putative Zinc finger transcription factor ace1 [Glarea lozoyensis 74030]EPE36597.1 C2H2 and C2HC zinc finger [Glarea lozoyensis ATCC 20868]
MSLTHPRRSTKTTLSALTPSSSGQVATSGRPTVNTTMSLRKGATFHSPPSPEAEETFIIPGPPRRAQSTLEDVVDAHERRVALTLADIDRGLAAVEDRSPTARQSFPDEADPIPQGFLNHTVGTPSESSYGPIMDGVMSKEPSLIGRRSLRPRHNRRPSRYSDSALGSSIGSRSGKMAADTAATSVTEETQTKSKAAASAITRSAAANSNVENLPRLSSRATNRIHEHILRPLLAKSSLKDFHPIVKDCPRRIHGKEIVCLRDLEKTLIFMAPVSDIQTDVVEGVAHWFSRLKERTKTAALYLDFCLTSIRCIQATVEFLSEREQTRPHDRPYTNGYFVDLVDQIKQYAQQVQAAKEKEEKGEKLGEMDPESTDEVRLHGGLTKNGRPAELVRVKKNGKAISVATGLPVELEDEDTKDSLRFKRSLSQEAEDDEAIMRSMARRKRSASAAELAPKRCREPGCDKEFKRPCDLTKHEKTHSRPWKCPVESCKYHEYGWPTEKEMDRHHNDKHSAAPPLYECHYKPCPYRSKRESNCKQHMEKAHGWEYVRSKNNGKNRDGKPSTNTVNGLATPQTTLAQTPSSHGDNVATPEDDDYGMPDAYDSATMFDQQNQLNFPEYNPDMDMFAPQQHLQLDFSPISELHQSGSSNGQSPYSDIHPGQDQFQNFSHSNNVDFNLFGDEDLYNAHAHLPTPTHDVFQRAIGAFETSGIPLGSDPVPHISPVGHGNTMLYTPTSLREVDEGFADDFAPTNCQPHIGHSNDFQLFPSNAGGNLGNSTTTGLFGEIPRPNFFPGTSAQDLLDFYAATTAAAIQHHNPQPMDWSSNEGQYNGYGSN